MPKTTERENKTAKRLLSLALALIMFIGCAPFALAAEEEEEEDIEKKEAERIALYLSAVYENQDEKLATFGEKTVEFNDGTEKKPVWRYEPNGKPVFEKDGYELYFQYDTGEVAVKDTKTGQVMFSNPWDVGSGTASEATKRQLMSQILIKYKEADKTTDFNSFEQAALNRQIKMKRIKGGIRVEYTLGREQKRMLVPGMIERSSFEENILVFVTNQRDYEKMKAYYTLKDANAPDLTERAKKELQVTYPQTQTYAIYIFDPNASAREYRQIEGFIRQYTKYTFEKMDEDHALLGYEPPNKAPPLFKMSLEYYIDEDGMYMRLPVNGLRFDESTYRVEYIRVLPYMGAGRRENTGYTFIPDGSGALVRFEDIKAEPFTLTNKLYGPDYSYHKTSGGPHSRRWRLPVYGTVEDYEITRTTKVEQQEAYYDASGARLEEPAVVSVDEEGNALDAPKTVYYDETGKELTSAKKIYVDSDGKEYDEAPKPETESRRDGFLAIIEEGDVMAEVSTDHGGNLHKYNTTFSQFSPRPLDEFNLDFDTTGVNSLITLAARRKYTGNYIIRYIMLSSDENGNPKKSGGYDASYVGMANAYRDYLIKNDQLEALTDDGSGIPLFVETLGTIDTSEYFFGVPYIGSTPLTTFEDVKSIIDELNSEGIKNIKFRLNGWINGGVISTAPTRIKIEKKLGGKKAFTDALEYASQKGATIYPDVDFAMVWRIRPFDGTNLKWDMARYMNQLYAWEQNYCFLCQEVEARFRSTRVITTERMDLMYSKAKKEYDKYEVGAMSVGSLASELHSNHYKKSLVNRAEARENITNLFDRIYEDQGNLLAAEANAYSFKYLDSAINVDLDSSRFMNQSEAVPFYGMVTHGYINIAGAPINMSGDMQYDLLKAIESGASPYFILSYQNSNRLKEASAWFLNSFYSVDYKTWLPDVLRVYNTLNGALASVRTKPIINHEFLGNNVVKVTYEGGTSFILNYNHFDEVTVEGHTIAPLDFVKIN